MVQCKGCGACVRYSKMELNKHNTALNEDVKRSIGQALVISHQLYGRSFFSEFAGPLQGLGIEVFSHVTYHKLARHRSL